MSSSVNVAANRVWALEAMNGVRKPPDNFSGMRNDEDMQPTR
jgi:hypothetical protein